MYNKIYKIIVYNFDDNQLIKFILSSFVESKASLKFIEMAMWKSQQTLKIIVCVL